jgi:D-arabinose 1-dehydrogenase-like Zn-dependent alcohol dehydrogenase
MLSYQVEAFGKPLAQVIRDTPVPQGSEVIVKVGSCGVCHSDVHLHDGYFDLGGDVKLDMTRTVQPPRTLGHEIAGTVVAVGPDAQGVKIGDRRVVFPWIGCGACSLCAAGNEHLCNKPAALGIHRDGGFSDHVSVPHPKYLLDYGSLAEEQACTYACSGLTAYSALKKVAPLGPKDPLLIIGAGGVGLSGIRLARKLFETPPIVVELDKSKWDIARDAGAGDVIDPNADGALKALMKSTGGVAAAIEQAHADDLAMVSMKAVTVMGSYVGSLAEMQELMAIARDGSLPNLPLTSQPLSTATDALAALRAGHIRGRTILKP